VSLLGLEGSSLVKEAVAVEGVLLLVVRAVVVSGVVSFRSLVVAFSLGQG